MSTAWRDQRRPRRPLQVPAPLPPLPPGEPPPPTGRTVRLAAGLATRADGLRLLLALFLIVAGVGLAVVGGRADMTLHRGVGSGAAAGTPAHTIGRDLATNVDLTRFEPTALDEVAVSLQLNSFRYVRQSFAWAEIEPEPGVFRWEEADAIIDALTRHQIVPVAVLHRSPAWARAPEQAEAFDAPPLDPAAYERFVAAFAGRYGERVPYLQLWDLPNRPDRWGGRPPDPTAYALLLAAGFAGARGGNPGATVVLAELDPWPEGAEGAGDLAFLNGIYAAGGAAIFDVAAARVDGGRRGPYDRRIDAATPSLSRLILLREAMVAAGDGETPVWATHYGWANDPAAGVDASRQAEFTIAGIERARAEWPWLGPLFVWGLRPGETIGGEVPPAYALLGPNNESTPLLEALAAANAAGLTDAAPVGFLPVDARQVAFSEGDWERQHLGPEAYRTTTNVGASVAVPFEGTGVTALVRAGPAAGDVEAIVDGAAVPIALGAFRAEDQELPVAAGLPLGRHELTLRLAGEGELTLGGLRVEREIPLRWPVALLVGAGGALAFLGFRGLISLVAERTGRLQRRRGVDLWPELPRLPAWQPQRRA